MFSKLNSLFAAAKSCYQLKPTLLCILGSGILAF